MFVVTGFTIGHSLTLALAVTGVLRPHAEYIDALVGAHHRVDRRGEHRGADAGSPTLSALGVGACLGLMALCRALGFGGLPSLLLLGAGLFTANYLMISGHLRDAGAIADPGVTLVFGLIHGFGFAADLLEMQLPTQTAGRAAGRLQPGRRGGSVGAGGRCDVAGAGIEALAACVAAPHRRRCRIGVSRGARGVLVCQQKLCLNAQGLDNQRRSAAAARRDVRDFAAGGTRAGCRWREVWDGLWSKDADLAATIVTQLRLPRALCSPSKSALRWACPVPFCRG